MNILVLGGGDVGKSVVTDLSCEHEIWVGDKHPMDIPGAVGTLAIDASRPELLKDHFDDMDMIVCALPSFLGHRILKTAIRSGVDIVDVSFSP